MEAGQNACHVEVHLAPILGRHAGQGGVVENAPLQPFHHVEGRAEDGRVFPRATARGVRAHRCPAAPRSTRNSRSTAWAPGRIGALGLLAQHEARVAPIDEPCRVRLPAADPLQGGQATAGQVGSQPACQRLRVDGARAAHADRTAVTVAISCAVAAQHEFLDLARGPFGAGGRRRSGAGA